MRHLVRIRAKKRGLPPGTMVHIGEKAVEKTRITIIDYDRDKLTSTETFDAADTFGYHDRPSVSWINVDGVHDTGLIQAICSEYGVHPLVQEDIVNTDQRPKAQQVDDILHVVVKMLTYDDAKREISDEQISLILVGTTLLSFQEREGDCLGIIRERLKKQQSRIRTSGADYLMYAILDTIVDFYFDSIEKIGTAIQAIEEELTSNPGQETLQAIHHEKQNLLLIRRSVWPIREMVTSLRSDDTFGLSDSLKIFLADLYDHVIQILDTLEIYRDLLSGMLDLYLSTISNRMNEVMMTLTVIATIFIPLTFIAGIYGMNFTYMPELQWKWGYFVCLGAMAAVLAGMLLYFRKRKWL